MSQPCFASIAPAGRTPALSVDLRTEYCRRSALFFSALLSGFHSLRVHRARGAHPSRPGRLRQLAALGGRDDEDPAARDGADESLGLQDLDCLLDGAPGYPVGLHEGLPARQRGTRRYLPGHDPLPQHVRELTVKRHVRGHVQGHANHPTHPRCPACLPSAPYTPCDPTRTETTP